MPEHGAEFTIISGQWGEGTTADDRYVIVLDFWPSSGFSIAESCSERKGMITSSASNFMDRDAIIGTEFAERLFSIVDAVHMKDSRLDKIRNWKSDAKYPHNPLP
ncbi:MAG: hypothetical protein COB08_005430 [Rhodobacteraceae bacterium]|nr:hypothetical protein [Paracoccaceae bacterium]